IVSLDGAPRKFLPGSYTLGTTVAVGTGGLATPREGVVFTADEETQLQSEGNVVIDLDPRRIDLLGPGKLVINGRLEVQFPDRTVDATTVNFNEAPYRVTVDPTPTTLAVDAVLQGPVDVS
ncbi:MAG: hypothetical protein M3144_11130, partial [Actinomycetota bacterium]|nr:hypothetical protein [Actinomycetota bacterium]